MLIDLTCRPVKFVVAFLFIFKCKALSEEALAWWMRPCKQGASRQGAVGCSAGLVEKVLSDKALQGAIGQGAGLVDKELAEEALA